MKIAICKSVENKSKDFTALAYDFENLELNAEQVAIEINKGHAFTVWHVGGASCRWTPADETEKATHKCPKQRDIQHRRQENFLAAGYIALDFDNGSLGILERLKTDNFTQDYLTIFYYSPSSTDELLKFRLFFELEQPIYDANYYRDCVAALIWRYTDFGAVADRACSDPCRLWYGHKDCKPLISNGGGKLPMSALSEVLELWRDRDRKKPQETAGSYSPKTASHSHKEAYLKAVLENTLDRVRSAPKGERHNSLIKAARLLGGFMAGESWLSEFELTGLLESAYKIHPDLNPREMSASIKYGLSIGQNSPLYVPIATLNGNRSEHFNAQWQKVSVDVSGEIIESGTNQEGFKIHNCTDLGNARRLVERFGSDLRHVTEWGWLVWNGQKWEIDEKAALRLAKKTVRTIYDEARNQEDDTARQRLAKWAISSENIGRVKAMLETAKDELEVSAKTENFDQQKMLLNVANGTLDLATGKLLPHNRANQLTKISPVEFQAGAACREWLLFLDTITDSNQELIDFLQRAIGYSLTGATKEQCLFLLYGTGRNGKSTFVETIAALLGDYARASNFTTFLEKQGDSPRNDIARLAGARFVSACETEQGRALAESVVKELTGGDVISARFLNKEFFEFKPMFKIFLAANHKPIIRGQDKGIWRRIKMIPFDVTIPENRVDKSLPEKLRAELPGILNWALAGCLAWQRDGLQEPEIVRAATEQYKDESDRLKDFLTECCVRGRKHKVEYKSLYKTYVSYCEENSERAIGKHGFTQALNERGFVIARGNDNKNFVHGLALASDREDMVVS